jgi:hypothetical protein
MNLLLHPLILVTFLPLVGFDRCLTARSQSQSDSIYRAGPRSSPFGISLWVLAIFDRTNPNLQLVIDQPWFQVAGLPVGFLMGIDGLSLLMVLLSLSSPRSPSLSSWTAVEERVKGFMIFFLLLEISMVGVFLALDLVLFFVFWEFTLVPMYFLIGIWGGSSECTPRSEILPVYDGRLDIDAAGDPVPRPPGGHLLGSRADRPGQYSCQRPDLAFPGLRGGLCYQSADVAAAFLAARCSRRSAHRRLGYPGGRSC